MPIKRFNRQYKKGKPYKDSRKFIIVCEGKREADYFSFFHKKYQRLIVEVLKPTGDSAPKKLKNQASKYIIEEEWDESLDDELWFIVDTDNWKEQLHELAQICKNSKNWYLANSNPCFEVWLFYHMKCEKVNETRPAKVKELLNREISGGYQLEKFISNLPKAISCASSLDKSKNQNIADNGISKVYQLCKKILELIPKENGKWKL